MSGWSFVGGWTLIGWGIIVLTRYPQYNQIVLKGLVPILFLVIILYEGKVVLQNRALNWYVLFMLWCSLSLVYSVNIPMTLGYLQTMLGNVVLWYIAYRLVLHVSNDFVLLLVIFLAFLFHAGQAILMPVEVIGQLGYGRAVGLFSNANALAFSMWYGVLVGLLLLVRLRVTWLKLLTVGSICLLLWVLFSTGSRKSALALFISFAVLGYYFIGRRYQGGFVWLLVAALCFYGVLLDFIVEYTVVGARLEPETLEGGAATRADLIREGWALFKSSPILGVGLGSFTSFSSSGLMSHNDYVEILSSTGIVGLFLYIPIFWVFFADSRVLCSQRDSVRTGGIAMAFLVGFLVLGLGRPSFLDPVAVFMFGFLQSLVNKEAFSVRLCHLRD